MWGGGEGVLGCERRYGERCGGDVGKSVGVWGKWGSIGGDVGKCVGVWGEMWREMRGNVLECGGGVRKCWKCVSV